MPQPFGMTTDCRHNTQLTQVAHKYTHTLTETDKQQLHLNSTHLAPPSLLPLPPLQLQHRQANKRNSKSKTKLLCMFQCYNVSCPPSPFDYFSYSLSVVAATAGGAAIQASLGWSCCSGCACIPAGPGLAGLATFGMGMGMK